MSLGLSQRQGRLLDVLGEHADAEGRCSLSQERLSELTGMPVAAVRNNARALDRKGLICVEVHFTAEGMRRRNVYVVVAEEFRGRR